MLVLLREAGHATHPTVLRLVITDSLTQLPELAANVLVQDGGLLFLCDTLLLTANIYVEFLLLWLVRRLYRVDVYYAIDRWGELLLWLREERGAWLVRCLLLLKDCALNHWLVEVGLARLLL